MRIFLTMIFFLLIFSCSKQEVKSNHTANNNATDSTQKKKFTLTTNQQKVLDGAKKCLEAKFSYDMTMGYYVCTYKDGENTGSKVFPGGDVAPDMGVCTDVIVRALRWGGVCDLQEEVYNDLKEQWTERDSEPGDEILTDSDREDIVPSEGRWAHHLAPDLLTGARMAGLL